MDRTDRIGLPLLAAAQLQRELWINESLMLVDGLVGGTIDGAVLSAPPSTAPAGRWHRVADGASGDWAGHDGQIAAMTSGGWRFVVPFEGLGLADAGDGARWRFSSGNWVRGIEEVSEIRVGGKRVLGSRQPAIADPVGGSVADAESRTAVIAILAALRSHGLTD